MGKLTANPRRFFGAFLSVVNTLSEEKGAAPQLLITPRRRLEKSSDCTHARSERSRCAALLDMADTDRAAGKPKYERKPLPAREMLILCIGIYS